LVLKQGDLVPEPQLALLHPRELQLIDRTLIEQGSDGRIEVAMLDLQDFDSLGNLTVVHDSPCRHDPQIAKLSVNASLQRPTDPVIDGFPSFVVARAEAWRQAGRVVIYLHPPFAKTGYSGKEFLPMHSAHQATLVAKHATLDRRIERESQRPRPDALMIARLKKQKLLIKEELALQ